MPLALCSQAEEKDDLGRSDSTPVRSTVVRKTNEQDGPIPARRALVAGRQRHMTP